MKKNMLFMFMIYVCGLLTTTVSAANLDVTEPIFCSIDDVVECTPGGECLNEEATDVNLPLFVKVDVAEKIINVPRAGENTRSTQIQSVTSLDGKLILQGAEQGVEGEDDAVGWTLSIDEEDGRMIFSASRETAGFIIFGACLQP